MKRIIICGVIGSSLLWVTAGCGKKTEPAPAAQGMATQGDPPPPTEKYEGLDLDQLTSDLRRWIVSNKQRPANFEEFASKAKVPVPAPPPGKKFELTKDMRVVLVNR